ncbi:TRAP transporter large permease [Roseomonas frigidaquae]|uniref:TRAP transporter large permease protein n=2 Tax=Falsiroseomonas frigidaquae TaxID=487318 RepID=A0ABX1EUS1_9PROT|nr:TRAP transporter large permease [Falsiroseomonas frigidaquae]NKE44078.1 TRAP transporter large permease [Falsiroseomonas frigidaquae]
MLAMLFSGLHVGVAMAAVALVGADLYLGAPVINALGTQLWGATDSFTLLAVPLFVLLGELLVKGGATDRMYKALAAWLGPLPGGLLHTNIGACAMFAAVSGSSVATAATIGTVALPNFESRRYDPRLVLGTIAAGATLGILIPPSINMIIYGAMTNTSVGRLYAAGVVPGLLLTGLFMLVAAGLCLWRPALGGAPEARLPLGERVRALGGLAAPVGLFVMVMGSIYAGWATPTESAAVGVVAAFVLAVLHGRFRVQLLHECFETTVTVSSMILLIVAAAFYLNFVLGILGVPQALSAFVTSLGVGPIGILFVLFVFYLVLGCFLETLSMMVGTIPIVVPIVVALGVDPVWFGIFLVIMCEIALITPPVGMNLYVVQGVRSSGSVGEVIQGTLPFLAAMVLLILLLIAFPGIALWLPGLAFD